MADLFYWSNFSMTTSSMMHVLVRGLNRVKFSVANQHIRKFNTIVNIYSVEKI